MTLAGSFISVPINRNTYGHYFFSGGTKNTNAYLHTYLYNRLKPHSMYWSSIITTTYNHLHMKSHWFAWTIISTLFFLLMQMKKHLWKIGFIISNHISLSGAYSFREEIGIILRVRSHLSRFSLGEGLDRIFIFLVILRNWAFSSPNMNELKDRLGVSWILDFV